MTDACFSCFLVPTSHLHHYLDSAGSASVVRSEGLARAGGVGAYRLTVQVIDKAHYPTPYIGWLTASSGTGTINCVRSDIGLDESTVFATSACIDVDISSISVLHLHGFTKYYSFHRLRSVAELDRSRCSIALPDSVLPFDWALGTRLQRDPTRTGLSSGPRYYNEVDNLMARYFDKEINSPFVNWISSCWDK